MTEQITCHACQIAQAVTACACGCGAASWPSPNDSTLEYSAKIKLGLVCRACESRHLEEDSTSKTYWGEPGSPIRQVMVGGLIAELKPHLGPKVEDDREDLIQADASKLSGLESLLKMWNK